jgi:U6 snRNA-associated Sm-like protein LSm7
MSERASFRGGRGGRGGGGDRRGGQQNRGGAGGGGGGAHQQQQQQQEKPKKENILDLTKYMDREVNVKFNGGREGVSLYILLLFFLKFFLTKNKKQSAAFSRVMIS